MDAFEKYTKAAVKKYHVHHDVQNDCIYVMFSLDEYSIKSVAKEALNYGFAVCDIHNVVPYPGRLYEIRLEQ